MNKQIPGLGKPITAVDVTYDGAYILATTDDYLMVVKTTYTDDSGRCVFATGLCHFFVGRGAGRGDHGRLPDGGQDDLHGRQRAVSKGPP